MTIFRYPLLIISLLIQLNAFHRVMLFLVELCEHLDAELMVGSASCLAAAVHGKDGISHVDTAQRNGRGKDVAQCASTCHITVVHKALASTPAFLHRQAKTDAE